MDFNMRYFIPGNSVNTYRVMFGILILVIIFSGFGRVLLQRKYWKCLTGFLLMGYWIIIIISTTIMGRTVTEMPQMELHPFWCIKDAWENRNLGNWYLIIANIVLFFPVGMILPLFFDKMRKCWKTLFVGFCFSLTIEMVQFLLHIGLLEVDDLINNTLGCLMGYSLFVILMWIRKKDAITALEKILVVILWIVIIGFLVVALGNGQPVFDYFIL